MINSQQGAIRMANFYRYDVFVNFFFYFDVINFFCICNYSVNSYRKNLTNENYFRIANPLWYLPCVGGLLLTYHYAFCDSSQVFMPPLFELGLFLFRSQFGIQIVFLIACLAHIGEAMYAFSVAQSVGCTNTKIAWFFQTLLLGYPSLRLLLSRSIVNNINRKKMK